MFNLLDRKGSGFLKTEQLGVALRSVGLRLTNEQIVELQSKAQTEFNDKISFEGYSDYIFEGRKIQKTDAELEAAFKVFDNGEQKGKIDIDNFRHALSTLGDKMPTEEIDGIIAEALKMGEPDEPGTIDYRKLMQLIQSIQ